MSRPFNFGINAAELFTQIQGMNNDEKASFITQFSIDLITLNGTSDYSKKTISNTLQIIEKRRESGKLGGRPKSETKAKVKQELNEGKAKPKLKRKEEVKEEKKESVMLPLCVAWKAFVDMRKTINKPLTEYAAKLRVNDLKKLMEQGEDPFAVLNQSIAANYQDLYAVKNKLISSLKEAASVPGYVYDRSVMPPSGTPEHDEWSKRTLSI